jgi:hypothetical protein
MVDQCIISWLYNSVSKDVCAIVRCPKATAYKIWHAIHGQFRDNELHRAVYLEAEFRNLVQGDVDITTYTASGSSPTHSVTSASRCTRRRRC